MNIKWLIYCRVSSLKQVKEWNGLSSQEKRCRDYAADVLWVEVEKVFNDEWVSGWLFERKSIQNLFKYIDNHKAENYVVIFEDLNRLSRDIQVHSLLKSEFKKRWVELACPNFQFEESPEWDFKENISVIVSQYEKDKNRQRVLQRMRARLEQGYWCFRIPIWYKYVEAPNGGKIMVKDSEKAKFIKEWLEKYADGLLYSLSDLLTYYHKKWLDIPGISENGDVRYTGQAHRVATNILYTWYLECKKWDIWLMEAQHEAIISMDTYNRVQKRLKWMSPIERKIEQSNARKNISEDFPLRWFLYCEESGHMFSSAWCKWSHDMFPYYTYPKKSPMKWKSINRDTFDKEFSKYLAMLTPSNSVLACFEKIFLDVYKNKNKVFEKQKAVLEQKIRDIDLKIDNYLERLGEASSSKLIKTYESKIENLESDKAILIEKISEKSQHLKNVWTNLKAKLKMVWNALFIWNSSNLKNKRSLVKLIFPQGIPINKKRQVWTPTFSLIYQAFELSKKSKSRLVEFIEQHLNDILFK